VDRSRTLSRAPAARWGRLLALGTLVGLLGGLAAALLEWGLEAGSSLLVHSIVGPRVDVGGMRVLIFDWRIVLLPALGGLASGLVVQRLFREPPGHGTDLLTRAFHQGLGVLHLKGPAIKSVAAAGVISCGGSAGPEGPIAALGAALGSVTGQTFGLTPRETRVMLIAGCAAGIGAIFQCPLGGALFATSILYSEPEFESDAMVPAFIASVIGYSTFIFFFHAEASSRLLGDVNDLGFSHPAELLPYAVLGPLCGGTAIFLGQALRTSERAFARSPIPLWLRPAFGGLATGIVACLLPQVMDGQYFFTRNALHLPPGTIEAGAADVWRWPLLFAAVALAKCIATALTVGSGASGGVLGPSVFIGGVVGAFLGALLQALGIDSFDEPLRQALIPVGMAGVLSAAMRTPLAAIVMVTEMTGSYGLIVPLMLVCVSAYVVGRRYGLNPEQVRTAADSPAHAADGLIHVLESWRIEGLMDPDWQLVVSRATRLGEMIGMIRPGTRPVFAVVDDERLLGVVSLPDIERVIADADSTLLTAVIAADLMTTHIDSVSPSDDVYEALNRFRASRHDVLPVVSRDRSGKRWRGMLTRRAIFDALREHTDTIHRQVLEEHSGLHAIDAEGRISELAMTVSPAGKEMIERRMVPLDALGRSLRQADFRSTYGVMVLGIELPDGTLQFPPDLDMPLDSAHRLVIIAPRVIANADTPT
jgi:CIC family chloride channel protein